MVAVRQNFQSNKHMEATEFPQVNLHLGEDQPEFQTLPAYHDGEGRVIACFKPSPEELAEIQRTGVIWYEQHCFDRPFQPMMIFAKSPFEEQAATPETSEACADTDKA